VGCLLAWVLSTALLAYPVMVGIPLESMGVEELVQGFGIPVPDALFGSVDARVVLMGPLAIGAGGLLASMFTMMRIRRLQPVEALRDEE
jgi:ABC-type lipoprotein release transport system permease subunit